MILFWLQCVGLVLAGLAVRRDAAATMNGLYLHFFGVRVRVACPKRPSYPLRSTVPPPMQHFLPTPRIITRAGP